MFPSDKALAVFREHEMCGMVRRFQKGITVDEETLAYDVIAGVGSGGNYLMETHTLERFRTEFWRPTVSSREGIDKWMAAGRMSPLAPGNAGKSWWRNTRTRRWTR